MTNAACSALMDLINVCVRMTPIFVCLRPRRAGRENIAGAVVYLWVVMLFAQALFPLSGQAYTLFRGGFGALLFLLLLLFFEGSLVEKAFLYLSAWLFAVLANSLTLFCVLFWGAAGPLTRAELGVLVSFLSACGFVLAMRLWLRGAAARLFTQLSPRSCTLLLAYPAIALLVLLLGFATLFDPAENGGTAVTVFYLALCGMIGAVYVLILHSTLQMIDRKRTTEELQLARRLLESQKEHYNQLLEHDQQVRIIRHDYRHHIHALLNMDRQALLQEYAARCEREGVAWDVKAALPDVLAVDDVSLCVILGNLLENAREACSRVVGERFIRVRARWLDGVLTLLVENSYDGAVRRDGGAFLSRKRDGGLGMVSIRRILDREGDCFDVCYDADTFTAMVDIADRSTAPAHSQKEGAHSL